MGSLPSLSYGSVYMKLWHGLVSLDNDPHPTVASMAQKVTNHIRSQVRRRINFSLFNNKSFVLKAWKVRNKFMH